tara:strand:+ start:243 stop:734 length:492 start_codon:yes stop_codon:yes gene_type:complete
MIIYLKNKDTLIFKDFKFKCCIGANGLSKKKEEGDKTTPKGIFKLGNLYYRADKRAKPNTNLKCKIITKNIGWCNDPLNKKYNKEIKISKKIKHEKLYRKDYKYNYLILIKYNYIKTIPNKGSAIFIHLTKNYKPTAGCIGLSEKDFKIMLKLIKKNTKIKIS